MEQLGFITVIQCSNLKIYQIKIQIKTPGISEHKKKCMVEFHPSLQRNGCIKKYKFNQAYLRIILWNGSKTSTLPMDHASTGTGVGVYKGYE